MPQSDSNDTSRWNKLKNHAAEIGTGAAKKTVTRSKYLYTGREQDRPETISISIAWEVQNSGGYRFRNS
ncbi:MAG: hypothetical protein EOO61_13595 [Hymenobacter sp.]|nr:MAG: hypothetical protein EOO61_13595 [Hymenobacter sp.]